MWEGGCVWEVRVCVGGESVRVWEVCVCIGCAIYFSVSRTLVSFPDLPSSTYITCSITHGISYDTDNDLCWGWFRSASWDQD